MVCDAIMEQHAFDRQTMILNSFDEDQDSSPHRGEKRVISEMDFFAEKKGRDEQDSSTLTEIKDNGDDQLHGLDINVRIPI